MRPSMCPVWPKPAHTLSHDEGVRRTRRPLSLTFAHTASRIMKSRRSSVQVGILSFFPRPDDVNNTSAAIRSGAFLPMFMR